MLSDESRFVLLQHDDHIKIRRKVHEAQQTSYSVTTVQTCRRSVSKTFWGCLYLHGLYSATISRNKMNSSQYMNLLKEHFIFQWLILCLKTMAFFRMIMLSVSHNV